MALHHINVLQIIEESKGSGKTIAEFLSVLLKDRVIEIYLGDSYEEISTEQVSVSYPAIICGKVIGAYRECLIINGGYVDRITKKIKTGNLLFISERAIRALNEVDSIGVFEDSLLRSRESLEVGKLFKEEP
jgi:hypothetical protein